MSESADKQKHTFSRFQHVCVNLVFVVVACLFLGSYSGKFSRSRSTYEWGYTKEDSATIRRRMANEAHSLAGPSAVNCGDVAWNDFAPSLDNPEGRRRADSCMVRAYKAHKAFIVHQSVGLGCGTGDYYIVGTPAGQVYNFEHIISSLPANSTRRKWRKPGVVKRNHEVLEDTARFRR